MRKLERLQALSEKNFREQVIVPLLARMGFRAPTVYHGTREFGKDVIAFDIDRLERRWYLGVVAKTHDISGSVSGNRSLREQVYQVEQCFDVPYRDIYGMAELTMDRVWLVTSGRVIPGAADSVFEKLQKQNLTKLIRIVAGEDLVRLLDEYYPSYWGEVESNDELRDQRDRALEIMTKTLKGLGVSREDRSRMIGYVNNGRHVPRISLDGSRVITRAGPYTIDMESIDPNVSYVFSTQCGVIRKQYLKAREALSRALMDVEEIIWNYDNVVEAQTPEEFLAKFDKLMRGEHPFFRPWRGAAGDAVSEINYLADGVRDVHDFEEALEAADCLEWSRAGFEAIWHSSPTIEPVLQSHEGETLDIYWLKQDDDPVLYPTFSAPLEGSAEFTSSHSCVRDSRKRFSRERVTRRVTTAEVVSEAAAEFRKVLEDRIDYEWP